MSLKIITFHFANNYGAVLQAYALREHLKQWGAFSFLNYAPKHLAGLYSQNPLYGWPHPREMLRRFKAVVLWRRQFKLFAEFRRERLRDSARLFSDRSKAERELRSAEVIIYGSDQIWNPGITKADELYFGGQTPSSAIKISYAASFGAAKDSEISGDYIERYLKKFQAVSVREPGGAALLKDRGIGEAKVVCDPVFLLDKRSWERLAVKPQEKIPERFLLFYALRRDNRLMERARSLEKKYGIPVYSIHPNGNDQFMIGNRLHRVGPREFLWLMINADFVCTNSFHAVAFAVMFRKRAAFSGYEAQDERVAFLMSLFDPETIRITDDMGDCLYGFERADFSRLEAFREESMQFLRETVGRNVNGSKAGGI